MGADMIKNTFYVCMKSSKNIFKILLNEFHVAIEVACLPNTGDAQCQ